MREPERWTLVTCSHCGQEAGVSAHGHSDAPDWQWNRIEVVPASRLREAVEGLRQLAEHELPDDAGTDALSLKVAAQAFLRSATANTYAR